MAATLCVTAFAEEPVVLEVSAQKHDGGTSHIGSYTDFAAGWSAAMDLADNKTLMKDNGYDRVVVDLYADWTAGDKGVFSKSGKGFWNETLYIENGVRMTINLNGHTINRKLQGWMDDGEVMYIDSDANVVINKGTITGGWSSNGAGGIHINDNARVILNGVHVVGNKVEDDDGGGIAVYDGAYLTMNAGSVSSNHLIEDYFSDCCGGGVYVEDSDAEFYEVLFENNVNEDGYGYGVAVYAEESHLIFEYCDFIDNGLENASAGTDAGDSIVYLYYGDAVFRNCLFDGNGSRIDDMSSVITMQGADLLLEKCDFTDNRQTYMLYGIDGAFCGSAVEAYDTDFTGNFALTYNLSRDSKGTFYNCTFERGTPNNSFSYTFDNPAKEVSEFDNLYFYDCTFDGATFLNKHNVITKSLKVGSILGEGSLNMVVSLTALAISVAALGIVIASNKKKVAVTSETEVEE